MHVQTIPASLFLAIMMLSTSFRQSRRTVAAFNGASSNSISRPRHHLVSSRSNRILYMSSMNRSHDYNSLKVAELRELLKQNGLPVTGIKAELIERLSGGDDHDVNVGEKTNEINAHSVPSNLKFMEYTDYSEEWDEEIIDDDADDNDDETDEGFDPNNTVHVKSQEKKTEGKQAKRRSFNAANSATQEDTSDDFLATRVFVQGIPKDATWQDLKDHFQIAGQVAFASVSIDRRTGESKGCGIVQYETPEMAATAIREMRNNPMNGETLYVRKDVQESRVRSTGERPQRTRRTENEYKVNLPSEWRRANDEVDGKSGQYDIDPKELKDIESLVIKRDMERRKRNYHVSDSMRDQLKEQYSVHLDDDLKLWWTDINGHVPGLISDIKGEGRWGKRQQWRQIPTTPENDAQVDSARVFELLAKRDKARKVKDFETADKLLQLVYEAPQNGLGMRLHDESRTWRIWTENPPPRQGPDGEMTAEELCLKLVGNHEPEKVHEVKSLLKKFPGREGVIYRKLKDRYES